jgi:hypothetical protein
MSNVPPIRSVYAEIRRILGDQISSGEALHFAAQIVRFCLEAKRERTTGHFTSEDAYQPEQQPFETWPIDVAMRDGGWMVLEYELDHIRPEVQIGRVHVYQAAAQLSYRVYAAETDPIDAEGDRVLRSLEWLYGNKRREEDANGTWNDFLGDEWN